MILAALVFAATFYIAVPAFAQVVTAFPDVVACQESGAWQAYIIAGEASGTIDTDAIYTNVYTAESIDFDTTTGLLDSILTPNPCDETITAISDMPYQQDFGAATTTATTTSPALPINEDEFLFILAILLFFAAIPFWERTFSVTRNSYDV